jgi:hypothetical protein
VLFSLITHSLIPAESHSPFVHIFTSSLPSDTSTIRLFVDSSAEVPTTWTYLAQDNLGESHWACKAKRFWPVRVVLEGPRETDVVPATEGVDDTRERKKRSKRSEGDVDFADEVRREKAREDELKKNTERNSLPSSSVLPNLAIDTSVRTIPSPSSSRRTRPPEPDVVSPSTPTIIESVKQLGTAVVASARPRLEDLKSWWQQQQSSRHLDEGDELEEERERRRRRRERRDRRRQREAEYEAASGGGRSRREDDEDAIYTQEVERLAREERQLEKEERRRKREERRRAERGE